MTARRLFLAVFLGGLGIGCTGKPFVLEGDANSVTLTYGGDMESATAVAKKHCAQYERVPRFHEIETEKSIAYFDCVRP